jgi:hypothetical protein
LIKTTDSRCAFCKLKGMEKRCRSLTGHAPAFCPTINKQECVEKTLAEYQIPEIHEFARQASLQEASCYISVIKSQWFILQSSHVCRKLLNLPNV